MDATDSLPLAWYGRLLVAIGLAVTVGTGAGLFLAPASMGPDFAWTIRVPLTAAFIGAGYLAGASLGLSLVLRDGIWPRVRIVLATAFALVATNLIATLRFMDEFHLSTGSARQQFTAWVWLVVYFGLPPAVLAVFVAHERRGGRAPWRVEVPLTALTRAVFAIAAIALALVGLWLFVFPEGWLADSWPWRLTPVSAAIVGTWPLTVAATFAWALLERDWRRVRIAVVPGVALALCDLFSAARLSDGFTGSDRAVAIYVVSVALVAAILAAATLSQRASERERRPESRRSSTDT